MISIELTSLKREVISRSQTFFSLFSFHIIITWLSNNIMLSLSVNEILMLSSHVKNESSIRRLIYVVYLFKCVLWWFYVWDWLFFKSRSKSHWDKQNVVEAWCILMSITICFSSSLSFRLVSSRRRHVERRSLFSRQQRDVVSTTFVSSMSLTSRSRDRCIDESTFTRKEDVTQCR